MKLGLVTWGLARGVLIDRSREGVFLCGEGPCQFCVLPSWTCRDQLAGTINSKMLTFSDSEGAMRSSWLCWFLMIAPPK